MKCPVDENTLVMSERQGIEIDYCPSCRGVWLDRGELDKVIERSAALEAPTRSRDRLEDDDDDHHHDRQAPWEDDHDQRLGRPAKKKKRGSFLGDLFELGE